MGADDESGDSSGNSGSHLRDAPTWTMSARRVPSARDGRAGASTDLDAAAVAAAPAAALKRSAADRDSQPARHVLAPLPVAPVLSSSALTSAAMGKKATATAAMPSSSAAAKKAVTAAAAAPARAGTPAGKENAQAPRDTTWRSNVDKWREQDGAASPRSRTPRAKAARAQWHLQPQHRYDQSAAASSPPPRAGGASRRAVELGDKSPGEQSRSGLRSPQPAEEPDAESPLSASTVSIEMEPLVAQAQATLPAQTKRPTERAPLLRPLSSIENDPEWAFRYASEARPDARAEFWKLSELSYPVIFTYVLEFLPGIVSMTIVGHLDSPLTKEYVDGVSLSTMFMNLTGVAFGFGLATAMDTLCSQAYGAGKPRKLGIYLQSGFIVLGVTVVPVFLLNWYTEQFLLWMGQPAEVARLAGRFSRLILPGIPFLYAYELFKKLLQAQNVVLPMVYIAVLSNVVNVALGVYLAFYTPWGYDGAAVARTVANVVLPASLVPFFMWRPEVFRQWWPGWRLAQALQHIRAFLTLGIPGMFMMLLEWWSFEIMAVFVGLLPNSVVAISVHSVLVSVSTMAFNVFLGISVATNIRVGNFVGSNQPEHAKLASALGMGLSLAASAALAVLIVAARAVLPRAFINDDESVALAAHALLFLMPYQLLDAVNSVMQGVFRGTGRNVLGAYINLFAYFAIGLPFGLYLAFPLHLGVEGLWLGLTAGIFGGCCVSVYKIYRTDWEDMADAARVRTS